MRRRNNDAGLFKTFGRQRRLGLRRYPRSARGPSLELRELARLDGEHREVPLGVVGLGVEVELAG
jgi:hypothetical protein